MILTLAEFWDPLCVFKHDLFPPALAVSSQTGGGQVIRARSFGDDLWRGRFWLEPSKRDFRNSAARMRDRHARLMLAQQPGVRFEVRYPSYRGYQQTAGLFSRHANNRQVVLDGLPQGFRLAVGDMLSIGYHLHTVTGATAATSLGRSTVQIMPHLHHTVTAGSAVELRAPKFLAVIGEISPARFESVIAGEASFTIMQVIQ